MYPYALLFWARPRPASPRERHLPPGPPGASSVYSLPPGGGKRASAQALFGCTTKIKNCFGCPSDTTFFRARQARCQNLGMNIVERYGLRKLIKGSERLGCVPQRTDAGGRAAEAARRACCSEL